MKFLFILFLSLGSLQAEPSKPNIILLMGDDHGWEEVGYNGHPYVKTPFLDEMASAGLRLDHFYAHPSCSPTRGSVLTGRHPNRYGEFRPGFSLRPEERSLAQLLNDAGYATAHFGKWHVGAVKQASPVSPGAMGFDHWLAHDNFFEMDPVLSLNGGKPKKYYGESSEILVDEAVKYIEKLDGKKPFFIIIWYGSPHEPYSGLATDLALYKDLPQKYSETTVKLTSNETGNRVSRPLRDVLIERYAEITAMDRSIGKLRNSLKTLDLKENTLLWYCGDNGIPPSGLRESRFRGLKGTVYQNGIRVPCVIEWPAGISSPMVSSVNSLTSDILPSICSLAGTKPHCLPLDGINLAPILEGKMTKRPGSLAFWNFAFDKNDQGKPYIDLKLQEGTTPLVKKSGSRFTRNFSNFHHPEIREKDYMGPRALIKDNYKLVIDGEKNSGIELFDLEQDQGEKNNLVKSHKEVAEKLQKELREWQTSVLNSLTGQDYK